MGYIRDHTIIVSSWKAEEVERARDEAARLCPPELGELVSPVMYAATNGHTSFYVAPDGSKEGWDTSDTGDQMRNAIIEYLSTKSSLRWVEVMFAEDDCYNRIVRSDDDGAH